MGSRRSPLTSRRRRPARRRVPHVRLDRARTAAAALALACAGALATLALGPVLPIGAVDVVHARHVSVEQAISQSGLRGAPIFGASAALARQRLRTLAAVRDASVEIALPDRARVALVEREAVGRWVVGATEWFVDDDGVLFPSADPTAAPALRIVDERATARQPGERLDPALVAVALTLARIAPGELRVDETRPEVRMTDDPLRGLVLRSGAGWEVRFGGPDRFDDKLALARRFLRENPQRRLDFLDVRSPDRIVISPQ